MKAFERGKHTTYYITDDGRVYSQGSYRGRLWFRERKTYLNKSRGYVYCRTGKRNYSVHRLVAEAFLPNPNNLPQVDHLNADRTDNRVENLEWVTIQENARRVVERGRHKSQKGQYKKYTQADYDKVVSLVESGLSYSKAGKEVGMPFGTVTNFMWKRRRDKENEN